ncbi:hypothetical protein STEG23_020551 [Scotinomys teguina]
MASGCSWVLGGDWGNSQVEIAEEPSMGRGWPVFRGKRYECTEFFPLCRCGMGRADPTVGIDSLSQPTLHSSSSTRTASMVSTLLSHHQRSFFLQRMETNTETTDEQCREVVLGTLSP